MNKKQILDKIINSKHLKRSMAENECENFINKMCLENPFKASYTKYLKAKFARHWANSDFEHEVLQAEFLKSKEEFETVLNDYGLTFDDLLPKYSCKFCSDSGKYNDKWCVCVKDELTKQLSMNCSSLDTLHTFDDCDKSIMTDEDIKTCDLLKTWCGKFPDVKKTNITLMGCSGSGKTFLLQCVANALIKKQVVVSFVTAFNLNEDARLYHCGSSYDFMDYLKADVLIIDDLGTEPIFKNVTVEYLYNLINSRQMKKLPTLISTNLNLKQIVERYEERIFSRLVDQRLSLSIQLPSTDKRVKQKETP